MVNTEDFEITITALDFTKCRDHVEKVLGYDIRDTLGKFNRIGFRDMEYLDWCDMEYRDWWHFLVERTDIRNGCYIHIGSSLLDGEDWQNDITKCFIREFGDGECYWVSW